jgi:hypothetical protein
MRAMLAALNAGWPRGISTSGSVLVIRKKSRLVAELAGMTDGDGVVPCTRFANEFPVVRLGNDAAVKLWQIVQN